MPPEASTHEDGDWLCSYLQTSTAQKNEAGGIKNGSRASLEQKRAGLRRRSWACPRESYEKEESGLDRILAAVRGGDVRTRVPDLEDMDDSLPSSRKGSRASSRRSSFQLRAEQVHPAAFCEAVTGGDMQAEEAPPALEAGSRKSTERNKSSQRKSAERRSVERRSSGEMYSTDGVGLPLFRVWTKEQAPEGERAPPPPPPSKPSRRGSVDLGDLAAVREKLVHATQTWAAEEKRQSGGGSGSGSSSSRRRSGVWSRGRQLSRELGEEARKLRHEISSALESATSGAAAGGLLAHRETVVVQSESSLPSPRGGNWLRGFGMGAAASPLTFAPHGDASAAAAAASAAMTEDSPLNGGSGSSSSRRWRRRSLFGDASSTSKAARGSIVGGGGGGGGGGVGCSGGQMSPAAMAACEIDATSGGGGRRRLSFFGYEAGGGADMDDDMAAAKKRARDARKVAPKPDGAGTGLSASGDEASPKTAGPSKKHSWVASLFRKGSAK
eukprot:jgi/Mesen1/6903/ME000353S05928